MDEKRTSLKAALRDLATEESGDIGLHYGVKRLIAYREGTLPAAEREAVEEHLSLCPQCTGLLLELRDFEAAAARGDAGPEPLRQAAWESLVQRLPAQTPAVRPIASAPREKPPLRRLLHFVVLAAAALLLAVAGLSVWAALTVERERERVARLEQQLEEREEALAALRRSLAEAERQLATARGPVQDPAKEPASRVEELESRIAELTSEIEELRRAPRGGTDRIAAASRIEVSATPRFALRGQRSPGNDFLRGGGAINPVRTPSPADRFTVAINLADHPTYGDYRLELMDRDGEVLWAGHRPGKTLLGDAGTSVSVRGLTPGLYRLRIEGLHPDRSELLAEYLFQIER